MNDKLKNFIIKTINTIWGKAIVGVLFCFVFYLFRKSMIVSQSTLVIINIILGVLGLVAIYQIVHERIIPLTKILLLASIAFIWNQFYIPDVFYQFFHIPLSSACLWGGVICAGIFCLTKFSERFVALFEFVEDVFLQSIENKKEKITKKLQTQNARKQNRQNRLSKMFLEKSQASVGSVEVVDESMDEQQRNTQVKSGVKENKTWGDNLLYILILFTIISGPIGVSIKLWNSDWVQLLKNISGSDFLNSIFSLICLMVLGVFIWTVFIGIIIKLVKTIFNIWKEKEQSSHYLFFAGGFLIISVYFTKQYNVTLDSVYNALARGDIFSYPLIIIVLLPIFLTFLESLHGYAEQSKKKEKIIELVHEIIIDIVRSLLTMVKFVSSSYLVSIIDIVQEDMEDGDETEDEGRTRKCADDGDDHDTTGSEERKEEEHC